MSEVHKVKVQVPPQEKGEKGERRREKGDDFPSKGTDIKKTRHTTCVTGESSVVDAGS